MSENKTGAINNEVAAVVDGVALGIGGAVVVAGAAVVAEKYPKSSLAAGALAAAAVAVDAGYKAADHIGMIARQAYDNVLMGTTPVNGPGDGIMVSTISQSVAGGGHTPHGLIDTVSSVGAQIVGGSDWYFSGVVDTYGGTVGHALAVDATVMGVATAAVAACVYGIHKLNSMAHRQDGTTTPSARMGRAVNLTPEAVPASFAMNTVVAASPTVSAQSSPSQAHAQPQPSRSGPKVTR